jgi:jasmonate ZIM domain-containing protein
MLTSCLQINFREREKQQLTIFYDGKVLVFNEFPPDKAKRLMQLVSKGNPIGQNVFNPNLGSEFSK